MLISRVCWESEGDDVVDYESAKRKSENNLRYFEAPDWLTKELSLVTARHQWPQAKEKSIPRVTYVYAPPPS